LVVFVVFGRVE